MTFFDKFSYLKSYQEIQSRIHGMFTYFFNDFINFYTQRNIKGCFVICSVIPFVELSCIIFIFNIKYILFIYQDCFTPLFIVPLLLYNLLDIIRFVRVPPLKTWCQNSNCIIYRIHIRDLCGLHLMAIVSILISFLIFLKKYSSRFRAMS